MPEVGTTHKPRGVQSKDGLPSQFRVLGFELWESGGAKSLQGSVRQGIRLDPLGRYLSLRVQGPK